MSPLRNLGASIAAIAMLAACGPKQAEPRNLAVKLGWNTAGVSIADGHGTFTTDLGYVVEADQFEVAAYSFELIPCEQPPPRPPGANPQRQSSLSLIGTAWAGHRVDHPPTLTNISHLERPLRYPARDLEQLRISDVAYCAGHYLIGRLPETAADSDAADAAGVGISLRVHGRYHKADSTAWTEFAVETPVSHGILIDLKPEGSAKGIRIRDGDAIVLVRWLGGVFNGVEFADMPPPEVARQILRQIVAGSTLVHEAAQGQRG